MCLIFGMPFLLWRWFEPVLVPVQAGYTGGWRKARTMIPGRGRSGQAGPLLDTAPGCKTYRNVHSLTVARRGPPRDEPSRMAALAETSTALRRAIRGHDHCSPGPGGYAERRVVARPPRRNYRLARRQIR